jgi:hypothetical protein
MNAVRFPVLMEHINSMWRNRKIFLKWYGVALLLAREDFLYVSVFQEHAYSDQCMMTGSNHFTHSDCTNYNQGTMPCFQNFVIGSRTNRQLLPLILFTDEATFTRNGINNTRNVRRWSHGNPHGTVETNFQRRVFIFLYLYDR